MDMKASGMVQTLLLAVLLAGFSATANSRVVMNPDLPYQDGQAVRDPRDLGVHAPNSSETLPNGDFDMGQTVMIRNRADTAESNYSSLFVDD